MKKCIKIFIVSAMMLVMVIGLTGCRKFEQMRRSQGKLSEDGILTVQEDEYRLLPACSYLNPDFSYSNGDIYLAAEDVPVLLSGRFGVRMEISKDRKFIGGALGSEEESFQDGKPYYDGSSYKVFCHVDEYDSIMEVIEKGYEPDGYKCDYYDWEEDGMVEHVFSDEEAKAVETVLSVTPSKEYTKGFMQSFSISSCVKGTPFSQYEVELMLADDDTYYFERYDEESEMSLYYQVPAELEPVFENIIITVNS